MGIFWSMKPEAEPKGGDHSFFAVTDWKAPLSSTLDVSCNGQRMGSMTIERRFVNAGIRHSEVRGYGLVGCLWEPDDDQLRSPGRRCPCSGSRRRVRKLRGPDVGIARTPPCAVTGLLRRSRV